MAQRSYYQRREPAAPDPSADAVDETKEAEAGTARVNDLSKLARTTWFGLLAYLVFVFITLLGVQDVDFFMPSRQTRLPLVNTAIPTQSFFWFAPIIGTALYAYLHVQLIKVWDALMAVPATIGGKPLQERIFPWLVNDFALRFHEEAEKATRLRPLRWLSGFVTRCLVWFAAPFVIAGFWWRSMPAHHEWLTLSIALCLLVALYVGASTWWHMRFVMQRAWKRTADGRFPSAWSGWFGLKRPIGLGIVALVVTTSWLRTEGGLEHTAGRAVALIDASFGMSLLTDCSVTDPETAAAVGGAVRPDCGDGQGGRRPLAEVRADRLAGIWWLPNLESVTYTSDHWLLGRWLEKDETWTWLARTDLRDQELTASAGDIRDFETARTRFRVEWCRHQGLETEVCGPPASPNADTPGHVWAKRGAWCAGGRYVDGAGGLDARACEKAFASLEAAFAGAWAEEWRVMLSRATRLDLRGRDLRQADLAGAFLANADLRGARLEGADLRGARLEGADARGANLDRANLHLARLEGARLERARLERANLAEARLEGADLKYARLDGASLRQARLEKADLRWARLEKADLVQARLQDANLFRVRLVGADLRQARLEGAKLMQAELVGADLRWARMEGADLWQAQLANAVLREARLEGADLLEATLTGANLWQAALQGANLQSARLAGAGLGGARLEGANLGGTKLLSARWTGSGLVAPAHHADLRGGEGLTQAMLHAVIGNRHTLLPHEPNETGAPYHVQTCWDSAPASYDRLLRKAGAGTARLTLNELFLCQRHGPGRTGRPWPADAEPPVGWRGPR